MVFHNSINWPTKIAQNSKQSSFDLYMVSTLFAFIVDSLGRVCYHFMN